MLDYFATISFSPKVQDEGFTCLQCRRVFGNRALMISHMHHTPGLILKKYTCSCTSTFELASDIICHLEREECPGTPPPAPVLSPSSAPVLPTEPAPPAAAPALVLSQGEALPAASTPSAAAPVPVPAENEGKEESSEVVKAKEEQCSKVQENILQKAEHQEPTIGRKRAKSCLEFSGCRSFP